MLFLFRFVVRYSPFISRTECTRNVIFKYPWIFLVQFWYCSVFSLFSICFSTYHLQVICRPACCSSNYTLFSYLQLSSEILLDQVLEAPGVQDWFVSATEIGNPDALLLALKMREKIGTDHKAFGKLLPSDYSPSKLFADDHLSSLTNCLKVTMIIVPFYE